ncbi:hypothetical protein BV360_01296 [Pseudomonas syringae pv. actinidiae]|uniref:Uncharacterized protein n=2 Tax=Pseudomonas syringae pv. actinidiae TaxID=103796 RepID=A0A2V0QN08_PSESF|nr:hypothetical protein AN901_203008 [Pseudomonas syringae pv. theae]OSN15223.1 hypothetical protein BV340_03998 [Pseudomonas syringae pv. actinidiae]OSN23611.1 hypothetical protein BV341_04066 [Pseudomonas syringae pv. actinidiae]OSN24194.1 hypothetical protein BV339_00664 [Pseudomonas syringae pv. actinidiae]OSN32390.1 hypothetical protein BV342_04128 [Pseudomonas syringae pv. actinidiae]
MAWRLNCVMRLTGFVEGNEIVAHVRLIVLKIGEPEVLNTRKIRLAA